ncbi:uncharacterized [Tachysurus ichikawai]
MREINAMWLSSKRKIQTCVCRPCGHGGGGDVESRGESRQRPLPPYAFWIRVSERSGVKGRELVSSDMFHTPPVLIGLSRCAHTPSQLPVGQELRVDYRAGPSPPSQIHHLRPAQRLF